ncbi:uncharacterized protein LOC133923147 [Phragmites australis]|uniref:uncharacterized protein LOC133923147 n=1 Tax=Phragmites australis TaxID=29695 RepID=UPI002D78C574|nr:uncharacterized protein LOC133923147 [Phragmites australis]
MASPLHINEREAEDRLSALADGILLNILHRLDLQTQILTSTLSTRWRLLPSLLTDLITDLCSIGDGVGSVAERGSTKFLEFVVMTEKHDLQCSEEENVQFGQRFMGFFSSCPSAFRWLTNLFIQNFRFDEQDVPNINAPRSQLMELVFDICSYIRVELIRIWIKPEDPKQLSRIFSNLRDLYLCDVFSECNLEWILYILEAAPSLKNFFLTVSRHVCGMNIYEGNLQRTNLQWEASSNFKHRSLNLLDIEGFEAPLVSNFPGRRLIRI